MKFEIIYENHKTLFVRNKDPQFKVEIQQGEGLYDFQVKGETYHLSPIEGLEKQLLNASKKAPSLIIQQGVQEFIRKIKK